MIDLYGFLKILQPTFSDYQREYSNRLQEFLNEFEDNTELFFAQREKVLVNKQLQLILDLLKDLNDNDPNGEKIINLGYNRLNTITKIKGFLEEKLKVAETKSSKINDDNVVKINLRSISIDDEKYNIAIKKLLDNQIITPTKDSYSVQKPKEDANLSYERWCCAIGLMLKDRHYIKPSTKQTEIVKALNNTFNLKLVKQNYSGLLKDLDKHKTQDYLKPLFFL